MCYPKPGPRCSTHALKKLLDAKAELNATDPTDIEKINEAKRKLTLAQEEYFTSPAGIKKLREKAKTTGESKYAKMADKYAAKRKAQLAEYKSFVADQESASKKVNDASTLEQDIAAEQSERELNRKLDADAQEQHHYKQALYQHKEKLQHIANEFANLERFRVPESLYSTKINADYDYDGQQCGYDGVCNAYEGDYCRDSRYVNLRVDSNSIRTGSTLADIYGCDEAHIPEDLEKIGKEELELDEAHSYDAEEISGYYGAEGADITLSNPHGVQQRLQQYYNEKHADISKRYAELKKNAPKPVVAASKDPKEKPKSTKPASKTSVARSKSPSKRGASKAVTTPATKPKAQRRERTEAELDAFERDAMPLPSSRARKALLNDTVKKTPTRPRKQWTEAEMDAFEADQMN
jgi:hypothetical protein